MANPNSTRAVPFVGRTYTWLKTKFLRVLPVSDNDISSEMSSSPGTPIKKIHRICDKSLMVIDEALAVKLRINNDHTWVEQRLHAENEILLVIRDFEEVC